MRRFRGQARAVCAGLCLILACASASAQFHVTFLHPAGYAFSYAAGISGTQQVGFGGPTNTTHALLWNGTSNSVVDLNPAGGYAISLASDTDGVRQVGFGYILTNNAFQALEWTGTAASAIDLDPAQPFGRSGANAIDSGQVVGVVGFFHFFGDHAALWTGSTAASWVDLHPAGFKESNAADVSHGWQAGYATDPMSGKKQAILWHSTAASALDLDPAGFDESSANAIYAAGGGTQEAGYASGVSTGGDKHAALWLGSAASFVDLNPAGFSISEALDTNGLFQVGYGIGAGTGGNNHALLWNGSAAGVVDLQTFLPNSFVSSAATGIDNAGDIVGEATDSQGVTQAVMWSRVVVPESDSLTLLLPVILAGLAVFCRRGYHGRRARSHQA